MVGLIVVFFNRLGHRWHYWWLPSWRHVAVSLSRVAETLRPGVAAHSPTSARCDTVCQVWLLLLLLRL